MRVGLPRAARYFLPQSDCPVLQGIFSHSQIAPCCKVFSPTVRLPRAARYFLPQSDCPVLQGIFSHSQIAPCCKVFSPTVRLPRAARYFLPQSDCPVLQGIFSHSQIAPCCKVFSPTVSCQCRLSYTVRTAPVCSCMHQHLYTRYKSQTLTAIPLFGYRKMLHTQVGMGSAALGAAVSYPGKATWISRSGQRGTNI